MNGRTNRSLVWNYFQAQSPGTAQCDVCHKLIRRTHCSTSSMKYHLNSVHGIDLQPNADHPTFTHATTSTRDRQPPDPPDPPDSEAGPFDAVHAHTATGLKTEPAGDKPGLVEGGPERVNRSKVWDHYVPLNAEEAMCQFCQKILIRRNASTSSMKYHLRSKHQIDANGQGAGSASGSLSRIPASRALTTPPGPSHTDSHRPDSRQPAQGRRAHQGSPDPASARWPRRNRSEVWDYFQVLSEQAALCVMCQKIVRRLNTSATGNLRYHLRSQHNLVVQAQSGRRRHRLPRGPPRVTAWPAHNDIELESGPSPDEDEEPDEKAGRTRPDYPASVEDLVESMIPSESAEEVLAKLVAVDGFTLPALLKSEFMSQALAAQGISLPAHWSDLAALLVAHARHLRAKAAEELAHLAAGGLRFSLTLDHWRSAPGSRRGSRLFTNIMCHSPGLAWSLGTIPRLDAHPPLTSATLTTRLTEFGLSADRDIVGATAHTALHMGVVDQRCVSHGLHQAIASVLYGPDDDVSDDDTSESEDDDAEDGIDTDEVRPRPVFVLSVRAILKRIVQSHVLKVIDSDLRAASHDEFKRPLALGSRSGWIRVLSAFNAVLNLKTCAQNRPLLSESDWTDVEGLTNLLQPLHLGLASLCGKDASLLSAEGVYVFMLHALKKVNTPLGEQMGAAILDCLVQRRQHDTVSLLKYLNHPKSIKEVAQFPFQAMPSRGHLERVAYRMGHHLFPDTFKGDDPEETSSLDASPPSGQPFVRDLMNGFERSGELPHALELLREALLTVPPTCVQSNQCQHTFSAKCVTSHFGSKMPYPVLDALIFLKGYYDQRE